ncbi:MAG: S9 family peptidase [Firmicutes bacterium]|nr:S9 family peptidase [Bacillota bacterium]
MVTVSPRTLMLDDFYLLTPVKEVRLSPDGQRLAYIQSQAIKEDNDYSSNLWMTLTDGSAEPYQISRQMVHDHHIRWSPDGRYLAILSKRGAELELKAPTKDGKDPEEPVDQIWVYDMLWGGEPRQITHRPEGAQSFSWAPDGTRLVFAGRDPSPQQVNYLKSIRDKKSPGPWVLDRVQHKYDGEGYLDDVNSHLFVVDVKSRSVQQITHGEASELNPQWSPDGSWILFQSNRTGDVDNNRRVDLWLITPDGSTAHRLTQGDVDAQHPAFSPDGRWVAFTSSTTPENQYVLTRLWKIALADASPISEFPANIGQGWSQIGGVVPDVFVGDPVANAQVYPKPFKRSPMEMVSKDFTGTIDGPVIWTESDQILTVASMLGQAKLVSFDSNGKWHVLQPPDRTGTVYDFDAQSSEIVLLMGFPDTGPEAFRLDNETLGPRLSRGSAEWLSNRQLGTFQWIQYANHEGETIEALMLTPPGFKPGTSRLPLLVSIHGGPMSYEAPEFEFETQYWAGRGYLVLLVNYRGSTSYGEAFCQSIQGSWGPREHDDVMGGVDYVIAQGWVDPDRLFITGFSMGGIMTNWAVGHTDRFRAAVTEHGVFDYVSAFGTDDCHLWWQDDMGVPWQNLERYYQTSPASGLANIHTPLLITAGEWDWRCPLSQAEQLYVSLKKRGVPTELVIYPKEHHESDSRPRRAIDRLARIDRWFAQYGGIPVE